MGNTNASQNIETEHVRLTTETTAQCKHCEQHFESYMHVNIPIMNQFWYEHMASCPFRVKEQFVSCKKRTQAPKDLYTYLCNNNVIPENAMEYYEQCGYMNVCSHSSSHTHSYSENECAIYVEGVFSYTLHFNMNKGGCTTTKWQEIYNYVMKFVNALEERKRGRTCSTIPLPLHIIVSNMSITFFDTEFMYDFLERMKPLIFSSVVTQESPVVEGEYTENVSMV